MRARSKILIVDDEPANRKLLSDLVAREGFEPVVAVGGAAALDLLAVTPVDLVLLDLMMPEVDGMAVLAELQRRGMLPSLPVVIVTAHEAREGRIDALTAGAIDFLTKPIDRFEVACKVRSLAELKRLRDAAATDARGARAQLQAVLDGAPDFVVALNREGVIQYANRAIPPYTIEELVGASWVEIASAPEARAARAAALERVFSTAEPAHLAFSVASAEGPRHYESHVGAVRLDQEIAGAVIVTRDVTEQKRTEMQLMISDRMASIGTLAAGVAHEINNPLAAVVANVDLALRDLDEIPETGSVDDLRDELRDARDAAERIRLIVRDLKLFSRSEDAESVAPVDLRRVLESTSRMAWNEVRHRAKLVKDFGPIPLVMANESRLGQVFLNLVVNAAQAIPEGDAEHHEIRMTTSVDAAGRAQVEIRDTGGGMPPEVLARLFTPFFTTKPPGVGTGLGLSICQRIVAALGGEIRVESALGRGTTFRVMFRPATHDAVEAPAAVAVIQRAALRRAQILVVDDEPLIGHVVRRVLARDHDVTVAERALDALELLRTRTFDVIFCDLMMPQMTGMDLYEQLRTTGGAEQASRIIFLTGGAFTQRARQFLDEVPNLRVEKPFDSAQLRALVIERLA